MPICTKRSEDQEYLIRTTTMRIIISVFVLSLILFSCKEEVKPNSENISAIINSNEYVITIDIVGGSIGGSFTDQMIIKVDNNAIKAKSDSYNFSKVLNDAEMDTLKSILNNLVEYHSPDKVPLKQGNCSSSDENYWVESDSIKMRIKPRYNRIYDKIKELLE